MLNFEILKLDAGHGYNLIFNDSNVAAGRTLTADFSALTSGTVILNGSAETDGSFDFVAGAASAITLTGGANGDVFDLTGAGSDTIHALAGNAGNDTYLFGGDFSNLNILAAIDGGTGIDTAEFNGDYTTLFLNFQKFANVETFKFDAGHSYGNVTIDENMVSGGITVDASAVTTLFHLTYTVNAFTVEVGSGGMIATSSATHNDTFVVTSESGLAASALDAGVGFDTLELNGDFSTLFTFGASTITNIEALNVDGGYDYNLKTIDATVASGKTLVVSAINLATNTFTFDGSAETDGSFSITGGSLDDTLTGGANGDSFIGGLGADTLTGGGGADTFNYAAGNNSNTGTLDKITDFTAGTDKFQTSFTTTFLGEFTSAAATGTLDGDLAAAFAANAGAAHSGFVFDFNGADFNGHSYLVVDSNGNGTYDAGTDLVVEITGHTGTVTSGDFI
jgi:Ca2+-binding RTX toxin-like protein